MYLIAVLKTVPIESILYPCKCVQVFLFSMYVGHARVINTSVFFNVHSKWEVPVNKQQTRQCGNGWVFLETGQMYS